MKTKNATAQRTMPIAHPGMPNAVLQTSLIESTHHRTHEAECKRDRHGEEHRKEFPEFALERCVYVINGTAGDRAVLMNDPCFLSKYRLGVDRRHAEECDDPHPEYRTGAADEDRAAGTDDISRTYLSGDRRCESLK